MARAGRQKDRTAWQAQRRAVIARAGGQCERCRMRRGHHVHHLLYADVIGHEPLTWLQLVCLECHAHEHPRHTFLPLWEQKAKAARRARARARQDDRLTRCAHCGGHYDRERHRAICVRFGLDGLSAAAKRQRRRDGQMG